MNVAFPEFTGLRCLMMPYVQGDSASVPDEYASYNDIIETVFVERGDIGFLTIDESFAVQGKPHRGARARYGRALHTEADKREKLLFWGGWGRSPLVTLRPDVRILLANNIDDSCALWDAEHIDTSLDGDIGHVAEDYPYDDATLMKAGEVCNIGIFTPHESLPIQASRNRQFLRIVSSGVFGREPYFTRNPLIVYN